MADVLLRDVIMDNVVVMMAVVLVSMRAGSFELDKLSLPTRVRLIVQLPRHHQGGGLLSLSLPSHSGVCFANKYCELSELMAVPVSKTRGN